MPRESKDAIARRKMAERAAKNKRPAEQEEELEAASVEKPKKAKKLKPGEVAVDDLKVAMLLQHEIAKTLNHAQMHSNESEDAQFDSNESKYAQIDSNDVSNTVDDIPVSASETSEDESAQIRSNALNEDQLVDATEVAASIHFVMDQEEAVDLRDSKPDDDSNTSEYAQIDSNEQNALKDAQKDSNALTESVQIDLNTLKAAQMNSNEPEHAQSDSNGVETAQIGSNASTSDSNALTNTLETAQLDSLPVAASPEIRSEIGSNRFSFESDKDPTKALQFGKIGRIEGPQLKLFVKLYAGCIASRSTITLPFNQSEIAEELDIKVATVRTILRRACGSGYMRLIPGRRGKGGFTQLELSEELMDELRLKCAQIGSEMRSSRAGGSSSSEATTLRVEETPTAKAASDQSEGGTPPSVGRSGATAERTATTPTTTNSPISNRAEDWRRADYKWAYAVVIPEIMEGRGFRQSHMLEFERNDYDPKEVQRSVEDFASALERGIDKKRKWKSPIAVFLEAMRDKGYYSLDTSTPEENEQQLKDARLDDLPFA